MGKDHTGGARKARGKPWAKEPKGVVSRRGGGKENGFQGGSEGHRETDLFKFTARGRWRGRSDEFLTNLTSFVQAPRELRALGRWGDR